MNTHLALLGKVILTILCILVGMPLAMSFESIRGFDNNHSTLWWLAVILGMLAIKIAGITIALVIPQVFIWTPREKTTQA